jgi:hypothetical protein
MGPSGILSRKMVRAKLTVECGSARKREADHILHIGGELIPVTGARNKPEPRRLDSSGDLCASRNKKTGLVPS